MKPIVRTSLFFFASAMAACSSEPRLSSSGLLVTVDVDPSSLSRCVLVLATPQTGAAAATGLIPRKDQLQVAVYKAPGWSGSVTLVARGYAGCSDDPASFIEESAPVTSDTYAGQVKLSLRGRNVGTDVDQDGKSGAEDCDDLDAGTYVGAPELCFPAEDRNCNGLRGCADFAACTGACLPNGQGSCQGTICAGPESAACTDGVDNDGDALTDCQDPDCLNAACDDNNGCTGTSQCVGDGGCQGPVTVVCGPAPAFCLLDTGVCNPGNGQCDYPPRPTTTACDDSNACTVNDLCAADGGCGSATLFACPATTNPCLNPGVCTNTQDAGCSYDVRLNQSCNDPNRCTLSGSGSCRSDAGCQGADNPNACGPPPNSCRDAGVCDPGTGACSYAPRSNQPCDDGNACTAGNTCTGGATPVCQSNGSAISCPALTLCHDAGVCDPGTGCRDAGVNCTPGACQTGGSCNPANGQCVFGQAPDGTPCGTGGGSCTSGSCSFTYTPFTSPVPSNFNPSTGPTAPSIVINCAATLRTGGSAGLGFTGCGGQWLDAGVGGVELIVQSSGAVPAALIRIPDFVLADGGSLTISGDNPAIIAVYGDAYVGGAIDVQAALAVNGPGGNPATLCIPPLAYDGADADGVTTGGSGGGGAAFGSTGGGGSPGEKNIASTGMAAATQLNLSPLRGGCVGGKGGATSATGSKAAGGGAGGAFQLSVAGKLRFAGTVKASGGGGRGGANGTGSAAGAGGGGSGGGVLLEAKQLALLGSAGIFANGGTGGEGGEGETGTTGTGTNGLNGRLSFGTTAFAGGVNGNGANGGAGGGGSTPGGANGGGVGGNRAGGGGGGGSSGAIRLNFGSICREANYVFTPSSAATSGGQGSGFSASAVLPGTSASCP